jgi:hypothetical protein
MSGVWRYGNTREAGGGEGGGYTPAAGTPPVVQQTPYDIFGPLSHTDPSKTPTVTKGDRIFGRKWNLSLYPATSTKGMDLSELHVTFSVNQQPWGSPSSLDCMIYNISNELINELILKQYTRIRLEAGYHSPQSRYGVLFDGNVFYTQRRNLNPTDSALRVVANHYDKTFTEAVMNTTLPAGSKAEDRYAACIASFKDIGVTKGESAKLPQEPSPRGRTMVGPTMDVLRDLTHSDNLTCNIDKGKLNTIQNDQYLNAGSDAFVLNSETGLIGVPQQELGAGLTIRSLLNPLIRPLVRVHVKEEDVARFAVPDPKGSATAGIAADPEAWQKLDLTARMRSDGFYRAFTVSHTGDNRGTPWYSDIHTTPLDPSKQMPSLVTKN